MTMSTATPLAAQAHTETSLATLRKGERAIITALVAATNAEQTVLRERLEQLGFLPGERLQVVALSFPDGDPMAVRLGNTTFALRRHETAMICIDRQA